MTLTTTNPNPNPMRTPPLKNYTFNLSSSMASSFSPSFLHRRSLSPPINLAGVDSLRLVPHRRNLTLSFVSFAASHHDSKPSESEIELEGNNLKQASKESQEAWEQAVASFKEHALKLQGVSQEAYEVYSKKAGVMLKETAEQLKIQADQAREDLNVMAKEIGEEGRQYLTVAAESSPEPVKDVVETFASAESFDDVSKVRDFYVGIPYGATLASGGFLKFMMTGSIAALRFGVILGGILLALSVSSLRSWRQGKVTDMTLKGQAAIASILFLRDMRLIYQQGLTFVGLAKTIISGGVAAFFIYRIIYDNKSKSQADVDGELQS